MHPLDARRHTISECSMPIRRLLSAARCLLSALPLMLAAPDLAAQEFVTLPRPIDLTSVAGFTSPFRFDSPASWAINVPDTVFATKGVAAPRSRALGAKRGFLIGLAGGLLIGVAISGDFLDEPMVTAVVAGGVLGLVGAGIGALVGATPPSPTNPDLRGSASR